MPLLTHARRLASRCLLPIARRAAQGYIPGEKLSDAIELGNRLIDQGLGVTYGYWDDGTEPPRQIADEYLACIRALAGQEHGYISIKAPSLKFSEELLGELVDEAARLRVRVHFDALAVDTVEQTQLTIDRLLDRGAELSYTLPGRWQRSVRDAAWAAERNLVVRVVKGQAADPADPKVDLRQGFSNVIGALAGRARHVAVASHDVPLVRQSVERLRGAGTTCELELLYGLPIKGPLQLADELGLGARMYLGYGVAYLPYAVGKASLNPRLLWWLLRDWFTSRRQHVASELARPEPAADSCRI